MKRATILIAALMLGGCYEYLPAPSGSATLRGRRVNLTLTDMGSAALAAQIGPANEAIGGTLLADTANTLLVSVNSVRHRNGMEQGWRGEQVVVPFQYVDRLERRSFSKRKTVLASLALSAALFTAHRAFVGPGGSNYPGGSPNGPAVPR